MNEKRQAPRHIKENEEKTSTHVKNRSPSKERKSDHHQYHYLIESNRMEATNLGGRIIFNPEFYTQVNYYSSVRVKYLFDMHKVKAFTSYTPPNSYLSVGGFYILLFPHFECSMYY